MKVGIRTNEIRQGRVLFDKSWYLTSTHIVKQKIYILGRGVLWNALSFVGSTFFNIWKFKMDWCVALVGLSAYYYFKNYK